MPDRPVPGAPVVTRWRKWDGARHWWHESIHLGADEWGDWVGQRPGWRSERPGRAVVVDHRSVTLVPPGGRWVLTQHDQPRGIRAYVDLTWHAAVEGGEATGVDMDLDVVRQVDGSIAIEDRDEWEEHRRLLAYPAAVVDLVEGLALEIEQRMIRWEPPFDDRTTDRWFARLDELAADPAWPGGERIRP